MFLNRGRAGFPRSPNRIRTTRDLQAKMSAGNPKSQALPEQPVSSPPSVNVTSTREALPAIPQFSYAQAAKGKAAPTRPMTHGNSPKTAEGESKRPASSDRGMGTADTDRSSVKRAVSEGRPPENRKKTDAVQHSIPSDRGDTPNVDHKAEGRVGVTSDATQKESHPSSPEYGTTSTSTLPKEDDGFTTGNGSSDSTWDKRSQSSGNEGKAAEKLESEEQPNLPIATTWDEEAPAPPQLKEAPPPMINFWQQRKEAQDAKSKIKQPPVQAPKTTNNPSVLRMVNGVAKSTDSPVEVRKPEFRKKTKNAPEERASEANVRAGHKESKARNTEDGKSTASSMAPPPPPGDAMSWPTPESAVSEERKKSYNQPKQDDAEKEKDTAQSSKSSGKKGWTTVPFVPTAVFNTPLPPARRGGRGPPGTSRDNQPRGRPNGAGAGANTAEKFNSSTFATAGPSSGNDRKSSAPTASTTNSLKSKRASSAGAVTSKDQRRPGDVDSTGVRNENGAEGTPNGHPRRTSTNESRRPTGVPVPATPQINKSAGRPPKPENGSPSAPVPGQDRPKEGLQQNDTFEVPPQSRASGAERRSEGSIRQSDLPKELQGNLAGRERGDDRPTRGRGGHRGRGGANQAQYNNSVSNGHAYANGQAYQYPQGFGPQPRSFSNHERIPSQSQAPYYGAPSTPHRSLRSTSRSHYNNPYMSAGGRFSHNANPGPSHLPNIQTDLANMSMYQPGAQGIMSAIPYNPYEEQVTLFDMVTMQMEYYFSLDNLCKDMFLRKHMDSQGYVFLGVLAGFNRIVALTQDVEMIRYVCLNSHKIEFKPGQMWADGRDRLRARESWKSFVLNMDQRDPSAQSDGPTPAPAQSSEQAHGADDRQNLSPRSNASSGTAEFPPYQSLNAIAPSTTSATAHEPMVNGNYNHTQTPLSAAVSEFSPSAHSHTSRRFASPDPRSQDTKPFTDEDVQHLQIFVRQPINSAIPPFHSASSRTFSNGSIDSRNITEEVSKSTERQSRPANGDVFER